MTTTINDRYNMRSYSRQLDRRSARIPASMPRIETIGNGSLQERNRDAASGRWLRRRYQVRRVRDRLSCALVVAIVAACGGDGPSEPRDSTPVSLELDMHQPDGGTAAATGPVLSAGRTYRVIVEGTYSIWNSEWSSGTCAGTADASPMFPSPGGTNGLVGVDAEVYFAVPSGSALCSEDIPGGAGGFRLSVDGGDDFDHPDPVTSAPNTLRADHTYEYEVTGEGHAILFEREDSPSSDNYGVLRITIVPR